MSAVIATHELTKSFFGITAVKDLSITVNEGEVLGLIGQNGAGKSTLMNLIGGVHQPDSGTMLLGGEQYQPRTPADATRSGIGFIHQELNLFTNLSIAENIFIDHLPTTGFGPFQFVNRKHLREQTREVLNNIGLNISPDTVVAQISPGERQLVEIAKVLYRDARLIIFDEPTTSLTTRESERLFDIINQLRDSGKAIIYISHILKDIETLADSIAVMRDGLLMEQSSIENFDIDRMISLMVGRKLEQLYPPRTCKPKDEILLEINDISAKGLVKDINLQLHEGEVLGLFGLMGSGRTELARIIFGMDDFDSGEIIALGEKQPNPTVRKSIRNKMAFVTENRREEGLLMNISIADNTTLVRLPDFAERFTQLINERQVRSAARMAANALQVKSSDINTQTAKALSGGNQQKVVIAKWILNQPTIFLMDEPTRGVDVGAKYEIYSIIDELASMGSGVLFISSEIEELIGMCDRIIVMNRGEVTNEFERSAFDEERILRAAFREEEAVKHEEVI